MKAVTILVLLGAVAALASDMKVEVHLNDHNGHEHSRFYVNPGDFSCAKVARTHAHDGQLHSKCGFQWSLERKSHAEITVGFHGPKSHLDVAFDLQCSDVIHAASAKGAKTLIHDNVAADGSHDSHVSGGSLHSSHFASGHSSLVETADHPILSHHSSSGSDSHSSSSSHHGIVLATLKVSDDKFLADLAQYCGHDSESSESSHESGESSSDESSGESSSDESSSGSDEGSSSGDESGSSSGDESASSSGSGSDSFSAEASASGSDSVSVSASSSDSLPANSQTSSL